MCSIDIQDVPKWRPKKKDPVVYEREYQNASKIIRNVLLCYSLTQDQLTYKEAKRDIVDLKYIICGCIMTTTKISETDCGKLLNMKHSTVNYALRKVEERLMEKGFSKKYYTLKLQSKQWCK